MELCENCTRLSMAKGHAGVPTHLSRVGISKKDAKVTFQYECAACGCAWNWERGAGWVSAVEPAPATPLLARLVAAARAHTGFNRH